MASEHGAGDLNTLPVINKIINFKPIAPLAGKLLGHKALGPFFKKMLDREIVTYIFFGVVTTIVGITLYWLCLLLGLSVFWSNIVSSVLAILFAFAVNKHFVFLSKDWALRKTAGELWKFAGGRLVVMYAESWLLKLLVEGWGFNNIISKIFTMILVMITNYIISKLIF